MKKVLSIIMAAVLLLVTLAGCASVGVSPTGDENENGMEIVSPSVEPNPASSPAPPEALRYEVVIPFQFDFVWPFENGYAVVNMGGVGVGQEVDGGQWGVIDRAGRFVVPLRALQDGESIWCPTFFPREEPLPNEEELRPNERNGKWGFVDRDGNVVIPHQYTAVWAFSEGLAWVKVGDWETGKWGVIDESGREIVPPKYYVSEGYDGIGGSNFSEGLALVSLDGSSWGFIDRSGNAVVSLQYAWGNAFSNGLAVVGDRETYKEGFVDKNGNVVVPLQYDSALSFSDGMAAVQRNGKWGFIAIR